MLQADEPCGFRVVCLPKLGKSLHVVWLHWGLQDFCFTKKGFNNDSNEEVEEDLAAYDLERDEENEGLQGISTGERLTSVSLYILV